MCSNWFCLQLANYQKVYCLPFNTLYSKHTPCSCLWLRHSCVSLCLDVCLILTFLLLLFLLPLTDLAMLLVSGCINSSRNHILATLYQIQNICVFFLFAFICIKFVYILMRFFCLFVIFCFPWYFAEYVYNQAHS